MLRVIAGELGGRRLRAPSGQRTRPTADRVREALFNILGPPPPAAVALDLYAGSGALGIEALSRGIIRTVFVEQDALACRVLGTNLAGLALRERSLLLTQPVRAALPQLAKHGPFHWIFADPPYASTEIPDLLESLARLALLGPQGRLCIERAARDNAPPAPAKFALVDKRRYGDTALWFYCLAGEAS